MKKILQKNDKKKKKKAKFLKNIYYHLSRDILKNEKNSVKG